MSKYKLFFKLNKCATSKLRTTSLPQKIYTLFREQQITNIFLFWPERLMYHSMRKYCPYSRRIICKSFMHIYTTTFGSMRCQGPLINITINSTKLNAISQSNLFPEAFLHQQQGFTMGEASVTYSFRGLC